MSKLSFEQNETRKIKTLREHYRREYQSGESDESFILWLENQLVRIYGNEEFAEDAS